jgi:hypothetical protein
MVIWDILTMSLFKVIVTTYVNLIQPRVVLILIRIPLTPMGVLAPGSAHARPSAQPPIDMSGNFPVHVSAESLF